ncbi:fimbrial protein [Atlantibacter sp.]|uniref:fimbrial protein n=1 Tax=Atlantibacter sp. TaxID=1903473 RepID=UPI0028A729B1|nr:fimbrial protein [Atlantibacter sp.]
MKKTLLGLALSGLFSIGAAQANDHSATLDISGTVTADVVECTIYTQASVSLTGKVGEMIAPGLTATNPINVPFSIGSSNTEGNNTCAGKVAIQLHGTADSTYNDVLANTDISEAGAKGVAIGIYDGTTNSPLPVNVAEIIPSTAGGSFGLQLVALGGETVVAGNVHSSLTLDVVRL